MGEKRKRGRPKSDDSVGSRYQFILSSEQRKKLDRLGGIGGGADWLRKKIDDAQESEVFGFAPEIPSCLTLNLKGDKRLD